MEARVYLYRREARAAAEAFANEEGGRYLQDRPKTIDHRTRGIVEDDRFAAEVGCWSGEMQAFEVVDRSWQRVGIFGFWAEDWEENSGFHDENSEG